MKHEGHKDRQTDRHYSKAIILSSSYKQYQESHITDSWNGDTTSSI